MMIFNKCTCLDLLLYKNHLESLKNTFLLWLTLSLKKDGTKRNSHQFSEDPFTILLLANQMISETENNFFSSLKHNMTSILVVILQWSFLKILLVNILRIKEHFCFLYQKSKNSQFKNNKFQKLCFYLIHIWYLLETIYRLHWIV